MIQSNFHKFSVDIVDRPFYAENDISYPKTAIISFYDIYGHLLFVDDYGYMTINEIYNKIEKEKEVNLDHCYVKNFSFTVYRRLLLINKTEKVAIKKISADHAFFHSDYIIDFSNLIIDDSDVNFSGCCFALGELNFSNTQFGNGNVDFSYAIFRGANNDFSNTIFGDGEVNFKNAIFLDGFKNFQYTNFGTGNTSFVNTDFGNGGVSFLNTNFNTGRISFKVARFGNGKVDFHFSKFGKGDISFERTDFGNGLVDFKTVEFGKGKVNFNRSVFGNGEVTFEASAIDGRITFKRTAFGDGDLNFELAEYENAEVNLEKATFGKCNLSFYEGRFSKLTLKGCHINYYADLRVKKCNEIDLSDTIIRDIVDFKPYEFKVDIGILNISAMRLLGTIYIDWNNNNVYQIISNQEKTSFSEKAEQFRLLKESFNATGQYDDEDKSYVWFKRYEHNSKYAEVLKQKKWRLLYKTPNYYFTKLIFDYMGLYATAPLRVLFSMLVTYAFFSLIYIFILTFEMGGIVSGLGGAHALLGVIGRSFYHSGVTFLTIGYGDFYPMGAVRWLSNVEGFVGVFLMSYFTVAFVRKALR